MILTFVVCSIGIVFCMFGMRRLGYKEGFVDGAHVGGISMMREMCLGNVRVEGDKLIIESDDLELRTEDGKPMTELSLEDLKFEKV